MTFRSANKFSVRVVNWKRKLSTHGGVNLPYPRAVEMEEERVLFTVVGNFEDFGLGKDETTLGVF